MPCLRPVVRQAQTICGRCWGCHCDSCRQESHRACCSHALAGHQAVPDIQRAHAHLVSVWTDVRVGHVTQGPRLVT